MPEIKEQTRALCAEFGRELYRAAPNELHFVVADNESVRRLFAELKRRQDEQDVGQFRLSTVVGNDERELEDNAFKLYFILSHTSADLFLWIQCVLRGTHEYPSPVEEFPAVVPFQRELADFLGLFPEGGSGASHAGGYLHDAYPPDLYPLRRDRTNEQLLRAIEDWQQQHTRLRAREETAEELRTGDMILPVGPVHAGVIEPGRFLFRAAGDIVEGLDIKLGFTHKGSERLFQSRYSFADGWRLAECIAGDSAFSHSLAYCYAVENLAGISVPREVELLRALFVELERITNHVGDLAALAHDLAADVCYSRLSVLRERMLRLNEQSAGHRLLRGLNEPGGIRIEAVDVQAIRQTLLELEPEFDEAARLLRSFPGFRGRVSEVGVLTKEQAMVCGATGFVARASGWLKSDFRVNHPYGIYREEKFRNVIQDRIDRQERESLPLRGDVLARIEVRINEVANSARLIHAVIEEWPVTLRAISLRPHEKEARDKALHDAPNFTAAVGYVEGWRGDIIYWVMKDKFARIYRCKVRDPSTLHWPALRAAIVPHGVDGSKGTAKTLIADFPVINKSFNLSYSGNDL